MNVSHCVIWKSRYRLIWTFVSIVIMITIELIFSLFAVVSSTWKKEYYYCIIFSLLLVFVNYTLQFFIFISMILPRKNLHAKINSYHGLLFVMKREEWMGHLQKCFAMQRESRNPSANKFSVNIVCLYYEAGGIGTKISWAWNIPGKDCLARGNKNLLHRLPR